MGLMAQGAKLLNGAVSAVFEQPLKLLTPGTPQRVWDEELEDFVDSPGEPVLELATLGSLQPVIRNLSRPEVPTTALVEEEQATYRAYFPNTREVATALAKPGLYVVDDNPQSLTYGDAFRLLKPPLQMGGAGSFRVELKEL